MTSNWTVRTWIYSVGVVVAPFTSLALGDPSPVLVALPLAVILFYGLVAAPDRDPVVDVEVDADRLPVHASTSLRLTVNAPGSIAHVRLGLPSGIDMAEVSGGRAVGREGLEVALRHGEGKATVLLEPRRWGTFTLGPSRATVAGPFRMALREADAGEAIDLVVLPDLEEARRLVEPLQTNLHVGEVVSSSRGPGVELAELRRWAPGDSRRMINWRASARSEDIWVSDRYADRNGDLVLVVDGIAPPASAVSETVRKVVELAASLVEQYGAARHRLGLVSLGGKVGWFGLGAGPVHEHQLLAALLDLSAERPPVWMAVDRILDRSVRAPSMVVFVSPLLDESVVGRIHRLSRAGIDVATVAVDASAWIPPGGNRVRDLAWRIWMMERDRTIEELRATGTAVAEWAPGRSLDELMEEVDLWRRRLRRARV